jgi:signal transduction histidine kinase
MLNLFLALSVRLTRIFFILALSLVYTSVCSQTNRIKDSTEVYHWLDKADQEAVTGTLPVALQFAQTALQLSKDKRVLTGEGFARLKIADILVLQSIDIGVEDHLSEAIRISGMLKDSFMLALACYQQGQFYMYNDRYTEAEMLFNRALALRFEREQSSYTASVYNDFGYLYGQTEDYEKEASWYLKAARVYEKAEDLKGLSTAMNNLGIVNHRMGNMEKAIGYAMEAIAMREKLGDILGLSNTCENLSRYYWNISLDSASKYQQKAMQYAEQTGIKHLLIRSYDNLSILMDKRRNKPEALAYIQKSIALCRETDDKIGLARKCSWAAILSADLKDSLGMEAYFEEAYLLIGGLNNKGLLRDYYGSRLSVFKKMKDYKNAFENMEKFQSYKDSLYQDQVTVNITELQTKYETEKKDNEIARLNTDQRIRELEIEKQKAVITGNELEAQQKENEIKLLSQQQELRDSRIEQQAEELEKQLLLARNSQQQLQLAAQEQQITQRQLASQKLTRNLILGGVAILLLLGWVLFNRYQLKKKIQQQNELLSVRHIIAKDLHDEIGSTLTSVKILSQVSHSHLQKDQVKASGMLEKITEQSAQMQQGMSDIVWAINPDNDKLSNILIRMREYAAHTLEPANMEVHFKIEENALEQSLDMQQRRDFFLIYKEAINNAAKYSKAGKVEIAIIRQNGSLHMDISDNGIGFTPGIIQSSNGLKNMKTRAESMGGSIDIVSSPGAGTRIHTKIPAT